MNERINALLLTVLGVEQGYSNHPDDPGGETCWGITAKVARAWGYIGAMAALPKAVALQILQQKYVTEPGFDRVLPLSGLLAAELVDIGVNQGPEIAIQFLQKSLNVFNKRATLYPDVLVDWVMHPETLDALRRFLLMRPGAEDVMMKALTCLRGARYIASGLAHPNLETFEFGWFVNRVHG